MKELTASEVAEKLGIKPRQVRNVRESMQLGRYIYGRWLFTAADVRAMRKRPGPGWRKGRPRRR